MGAPGSLVAGEDISFDGIIKQVDDCIYDRVPALTKLIKDKRFSNSNRDSYKLLLESEFLLLQELSEELDNYVSDSRYEGLKNLVESISEEIEILIY